MTKLKINWKAIPDALSTIKKYGKQHLPTILVVTGLGLSVYSKFLTAHESVKAEKAIDYEATKRLNEKEKPLDRWDRAKIYFEYCWLSMLVETGGIVMILAAHKINLGKIAAMTSLYQFSKTELVGLKEKIVDEGWKGTLKKLEREIRGERIDPSTLTPDDIFETGRGNTLFIDEFTGGAWHGTFADVSMAITELNTGLQEDNYYELTDFLENIGESTRHRKCGKYHAFRYSSPRDLIHSNYIVHWEDSVDPTTGEPRVCYIDYTNYLTPSDDYIERRPY